MFACIVRSDSTALAVDTCATLIHALRVLLAQVDYLRAQLAKSVAEGARLGQELKRTQESLLFLSAWDEEKIELESEVSGVCGRNDPGPMVVLVFTLRTVAICCGFCSRTKYHRTVVGLSVCLPACLPACLSSFCLRV